MKKYVYSSAIALLLVGLVSASVSAAAASMVGKKVQSVISVFVNGEKIKDAVVIEGTTYVPVRSFSETTGYSINIKGGDVLLTAPESINRTEEDVVAEIKAKNRLDILQNDVTFWKSQLSGEKEAAELARKSIEKIDALNANSSAEAPKVDDAIVKEKLANAEAAISELEAKITAAEAEIAELQAKIDASK